MATLIRDNSFRGNRQSGSDDGFSARTTTVKDSSTRRRNHTSTSNTPAVIPMSKRITPVHTAPETPRPPVKEIKTEAQISTEPAASEESTEEETEDLSKLTDNVIIDFKASAYSDTMSAIRRVVMKTGSHPLQFLLDMNYTDSKAWFQKALAEVKKGKKPNEEESEGNLLDAILQVYEDRKKKKAKKK